MKRLIVPAVALFLTLWVTPPTTPFYLDASVGHLGPHSNAATAPSPEHERISLPCGDDFQSNAIAAAYEVGQGHARNEDHASRSVPFDRFIIPTNSNRAGAAVIMSSQCDATSTTPTEASEEVVLNSIGSVDLPNDDGAERHGWARWSPVWKGTISLPDKGDGSTYSVKVSLSDSNTYPDALNACKVQLAEKTDSLPNNGAVEIPSKFGPGDYRLIVDCDRPEVTTFDETITIKIAARIGVPVDQRERNK